MLTIVFELNQGCGCDRSRGVCASYLHRYFPTSADESNNQRRRLDPNDDDDDDDDDDEEDEESGGMNDNVRDAVFDRTTMGVVEEDGASKKDRARAPDVKEDAHLKTGARQKRRKNLKEREESELVTTRQHIGVNRNVNDDDVEDNVNDDDYEEIGANRLTDSEFERWLYSRGVRPPRHSSPPLVLLSSRFNEDSIEEGEIPPLASASESESDSEGDKQEQ